MIIGWPLVGSMSIAAGCTGALRSGGRGGAVRWGLEMFSIVVWKHVSLVKFIGA